MNVIMNENEWAREMITSRSLGRKPFETMRRVARFYLDNHYKKKEVRRMMDAFLLQCDHTASVPQWSDMLDKALERAMRSKAIEIDHIDVTDREIDLVKGLAGIQLQRLAFTLLCLSKYWNIVNGTDTYWVNSKDSDIMSMANINTSVKRQSAMYHTLNVCGMIQFSRMVDNTNIRVCFSSPGEVAMRISDFRNLGYQYMKYLGGPFFECENCGVTTRMRNPKNGRRQKYCSECASEIAIRQRVNSVMRLHESRVSAGVYQN